MISADISKGQKAMNILLFVWAFIESLMLSATNFLNRYTRDYRYVVKVLKKEKKILKVTKKALIDCCFSLGLKLSGEN